MGQGNGRYDFQGFFLTPEPVRLSNGLFADRVPRHSSLLQSRATMLRGHATDEKEISIRMPSPLTGSDVWKAVLGRTVRPHWGWD